MLVKITNYCMASYALQGYFENRCTTLFLRHCIAIIYEFEVVVETIIVVVNVSIWCGRTALMGYQSQFVDQTLQQVMQKYPRKGRGTMTEERIESSGMKKKVVDPDSDEEEEEEDKDGKDTRKVKPVLSRKLKQQTASMKSVAKVDRCFR